MNKTDKVKVTEIIDGKTFKGKRATSPPSKSTKNDERFILESVDPPEEETLGYENAKKALADLIEGKEVMIEEIETKNHYGKTLVKVTTKEKTPNEVITLDINALMQKQDKKRYQ